MARLTIDIEELDKLLSTKLVSCLEKELNLACQKREDYQVLAVIGSLEEIAGAIKIMQREGIKK